MIPKNLKYVNKKDSAYARNFTSNIAPQNGMGPYNGGETVIINIPTAQNLVMAGSESYLKFDLEIVNGGGAAANPYCRLDRAGAHGVIDRLRTYSSGLMEDLENYGNIVAGMMSLQQSGDAAKGKMNLLAGISNEYCPSAVETQIFPIMAGERLSTGGNVIGTIALGAGKTGKRTYCINLLSIVGSLSDKYVPLFAMTAGGPLKIELKLVGSPHQFCNAKDALASYNISNVEFVGQFIELGAEAMNIINNSMPNGRLEWIVPRWSNFSSNYMLDTTVTQASLPVAAKYTSLKSLLLTQRLYAAGALTFFPFGSNTFGLKEYRVRIGSQVVPSKAPASIPEFFCEAVKAIGSISDINHEPNIDYYNYSAALPVANAETGDTVVSSANSPAFLVGIDLETYSNADKDSIYSGYNTSNSDVFWNLSFNAQPTTAVNVRFDTYALYDQVITCENGVVTTTW